MAIRTHPGDDGLVRVVDLKTGSGHCRRPIHRLAPLRINAEDKKMSDDNTSIQDENQTKPSLIVSIPVNKIQNIDTIVRKQDRGLKTNTPAVPNKKRRTCINPNLLTTIIALMLLPLILGTKFRNIHFGNQLGIHFEEIGSTMISPTEWQLLVYYDLKGFWTELSILSNGTKALNHLCSEMKQTATCSSLVKHFEHMEAELIMDSTLLSGRRHKRAALDLVGNIAHSLFGVLDSEYAENMVNTIAQVKENEAHLLNLLKNQTSVVDSTINIIKSNQERIKAKFDHIDNQIEQIYSRIRNDSKEQQEERLYRIFSTLSIQLTIIAAELQRTQSSILDVLTDTHHGIISPLLLTPNQLQHEVDKIKFHLPKALELPVKQEDTLQLYKLMKVKGGLTKDTVLFSISVPLIESRRFTVFNLVAIPNWINGTMISIKLCSSLLAINIAHNQYFTISDADLSSCKIIREDLYLCSKMQIQYEEGSTACACEINMFYNKTQSECALRQTKDPDVWTALRHRNQYLYSMPVTADATVVCNKEITQITLEESGLLILEPECILKHNFMTIQAQQVITSSMKTSYSSLWNITEQIHIACVKPLLDGIKAEQYLPQIKNLTELQTSLATQEVLQLPNKINNHNYHHMTIGYTSLLLIACIFIYIKYKQHYRPSAFTPPIPAPRNQLETTDFTIHI